MPAAQVELKTLGITPRRAMEQIVEHKNARDFGFNAGKRFLPGYSHIRIHNRDFAGFCSSRMGGY